LLDRTGDDDISNFRLRWWPKPPAIASYGVAVLSVTAALILGRLLDIHLVGAPVSLFLCAIMLSALFGGVRAGLLAVALSLLAFDYYFVTPLYSLVVEIKELPRFLIFALSALFVGLLGAGQRRATESVRDARDDLSRTVQELKRTNEALQTENTDRKRAEMLLAGEKRLLEMIARGEPLALILDALCRLVEELASGCLSSILLLDPNTNRLRHGSAPSLPSKYAEAIDGLVIGPSVGSCGTAAYRAEPVIVTDIATDSLWADYRELALGHGLRACWSTPIMSSERKVLGTFAIYYREPRSPTQQEYGLIARITHLASIAVERKRGEEALHQAQTDLAHVSRVTMMGELTASLAHEVNQPITAAVTNANASVRWLAGDPPNIQEARAAATRSAKDGRRAAEIISRIRQLFEKGTAEQEPVDINEVIREIIILLRSETTRYSISVRTELATGLPSLTGDRVQLQQVFMNLVLNSIDAMKDVKDKRELFITSQRWENDQVLMSVRDTGSGLPSQHKDQIFEAFFTTKLHGTGMGLSISRSIVESHGGRLWADGNSVRGATFFIALPTRAEAH